MLKLVWSAPFLEKENQPEPAFRSQQIRNRMIRNEAGIFVKIMNHLFSSSIYTEVSLEPAISQVRNPA